MASSLSISSGDGGGSERSLPERGLDRRLFRAAGDGDGEAVQRLLERGAAASAASARGWTALHVAADRGRPEAVEVLLRFGALLGARSDLGMTPLHRAAFRGHATAAELLLRRGAAAGEPDGSGDTPLHLAARHGHRSTCELLLQREAAVDARDGAGETPLLRAAAAGHAGCVDLLLRRGADRAARDADGKTALHWAASYGRVATLEMLLQRGADPEARDDRGKTAVHEAAREGHRAAVELLLRRGANPAARTLNGRTPLDMAERRGHDELAALLRSPPLRSLSRAEQLLLDAASVGDDAEVARLVAARGLDVNCRDHNGVSPLHRAAWEGRKAACEALLDAGAELGARDAADGMTPLHMAVFQGHASVCKLLLRRGASLSLRDNPGKTPLELARLLGRPSVTRVLESPPGRPSAAAAEAGMTAGGASDARLLYVYPRDGLNRHGHGNARPSYFALGFASLEAMRVAVPPAEYLAFCDEHRECCARPDAGKRRRRADRRAAMARVADAVAARARALGSPSGATSYFDDDEEEDREEDGAA